MARLVLQFKLLGLIVLVLAEIAMNVANVNHVVRFASGIDNNESLRRLWSRPESIIFCPVRWPILLSWLFAWGIHAIVQSILVGLLQLVDAVDRPNHLSLNSELLVLLAASAASSLAGTALYVTFGGGGKLPILSGNVCLAVFLSLPRVLAGWHSQPGVLALWVIFLVVLTAFSGLWASHTAKNRAASSSVVRELMPDRTKVAPPQKGNSAVIATGCVILLCILRGWDELLIRYVESRHLNDVYLAQVLRNFGGLMVLTGCSFVAIRLANSSIGRRPVEWQWWSMLAPLSVLAVVEVVIFCIKKFGLQREGPPTALASLAVVLQYLDRLVMYGTAGFLGCAVYLGVLAKAALEALDPGVDGGNELILDDDDDSEFDEPI